VSSLLTRCTYIRGEPINLNLDTFDNVRLHYEWSVPLTDVETFSTMREISLATKTVHIRCQYGPRRLDRIRAKTFVQKSIINNRIISRRYVRCTSFILSYGSHDDDAYKLANRFLLLTVKRNRLKGPFAERLFDESLDRN